jgi:hypothetical protein
MDKWCRSWYEFAFEKEYHKSRGNSFQDLFCDIMERCHPQDFQRVRPWGRYGDEKNDGYMKSERMLFQIYAPNEMTQERTLSKIEADFNGALPYWKDYFDKWVFTHNSRQGLSAAVLKKLLDLQNDHPGIKCLNWGYIEIINKLLSLNENDIAQILGPCPSIQDMLDTGYPEIQIVLETIMQKEPMQNQDLNPVSQRKLSSNALSPYVQDLINYGKIKSTYVGTFFKEYYDPEFGDKIAKAFNDKYTEFKNQQLPPDIIFAKLEEFAGGSIRQPPRNEAAILAVLTYLFEECDIFERPREEAFS